MKVKTQALISRARSDLHVALNHTLFKTDAAGIPSIADMCSKSSVEFAKGIFLRINAKAGKRVKAQTSGTESETEIEKFLMNTFRELTSLRPGQWVIGRGNTAIENFQQFQHLSEIRAATKENAALAASIGQDYLIRPDIVICRKPESDQFLNATKCIVDDSSANMTGLREINNPHLILHASISCKWTLRSDRAQNARSECLNLIPNRKGKVPHIAVVTAEPLPSRIASLALGTGDIDFVYHVALNELVDAIMATDHDDSKEMIHSMISGNRLRDISDLPLDLAI